MSAFDDAPWLRYHCRICNKIAAHEDSWIDLDVTGRFWLCAEHWGDAEASIYFKTETGEIDIETPMGVYKLWPFASPVEYMS